MQTLHMVLKGLQESLRAISTWHHTLCIDVLAAVLNPQGCRCISSTCMLLLCSGKMTCSKDKQYFAACSWCWRLCSGRLRSSIPAGRSLRDAMQLVTNAWCLMHSLLPMDDFTALIARWLPNRWQQAT